MSEMLFIERRVGLRVVSTEYTEWQRPLFWRTFHHDGKISPGCWGRGGVHTHSHSLQYIYHRVQSCCVGSSWEGRYTPPISSLPLYVLCGGIRWCRMLSRGLAQHGGPPGWLEVTDPAGCDFVRDVPYCPLCLPWPTKPLAPVWGWSYNSNCCWCCCWSFSY